MGGALVSGRSWSLSAAETAACRAALRFSTSPLPPGETVGRGQGPQWSGVGACSARACLLSCCLLPRGLQGPAGSGRPEGRPEEQNDQPEAELRTRLPGA